nr:hypothetical protein [Sporomusa sp.]
MRHNIFGSVYKYSRGGAPQDIQAGVFIAQKVRVDFPVKKFQCGEFMSRPGFQHSV